MAKGLRSSIKKSHRSKLRARVFQPVETARAERIHAKLLEIVQQPKPEQPKKSDMEIDSAEESATAQKDDDNAQEMDVDDLDPSTTSTSRKGKRTGEKKSKKRIQKPRNLISFPKSRGKGALKPFSDNKVRKRK